MSPFYATPWCLVAQLGEIKVEVVVGRLVVQVDSQFTGGKVVLLQNDFLNHKERDIMFLFLLSV